MECPHLHQREKVGKSLNHGTSRNIIPWDGLMMSYAVFHRGCVPSSSPPTNTCVKGDANQPWGLPSLENDAGIQPFPEQLTQPRNPRIYLDGSFVRTVRFCCFSSMVRTPSCGRVQRCHLFLELVGTVKMPCERSDHTSAHVFFWERLSVGLFYKKRAEIIHPHILHFHIISILHLQIRHLQIRHLQILQRSLSVTVFVLHLRIPHLHLCFPFIHLHNSSHFASIIFIKIICYSCHPCVAVHNSILTCFFCSVLILETE